MKCLSLWQPWASAVELGVKRYETRSWSTKVRGRIAIHAAKRCDRIMLRALQARIGADRIPSNPPLGAIIATAEIVECVEAEDVRHQIDFRELFLGDYSDGRWAWKLADVRPLRIRLAWSGMQRFFDVPDEMIRDAE